MRSGVHPAVSVVIPCYNGERYLGETIRSIIAQSRPPDEIIVVDDGSTDHSAQVAASFGRAVRVRSQENRGESVARNRGLDESMGDWVAFCDADDLWAGSKLEEQLAVVEDDTAAVATRTVDWQCWPGGVTRVREEPEPADWFDFMLEIGAPFQISSLMVRRELPVRFDEQIRHGEDLIYLLNLVRAGTVKRVDQALTTYRLHAGSQSKSRRLVALDWHKACDDWLTRNEAGLTPSEVDRARVLASKRIVAAAWKAFYARDWAGLAEVTTYGRKQPVPGLVSRLPRRRFPAFVYQIHDRWRDRRAPPSKPAD